MASVGDAYLYQGGTDWREVSELNNIKPKIAFITHCSDNSFSSYHGDMFNNGIAIISNKSAHLAHVILPYTFCNI